MLYIQAENPRLHVKADASTVAVHHQYFLDEVVPTFHLKLHYIFNYESEENLIERKISKQ